MAVSGIIIQGDNAKLGKLIDTLKLLETLPIQAAVNTVPVIKSLLAQEFQSSKSPYGERWDRLKKPTGYPPIWGLKDYFLVENKRNVVSVDHKKPYAKFHQTGTRFMPARSFLPEGKLGQAWEKSIGEKISNVVEALILKNFVSSGVINKALKKGAA